MPTQTLVDAIYQYLQEDILSGQFRPGERLHIAQLAARYKSGPGPVREALSRLLSTELVIAISQRGFRVAPVSYTDLHDIYQTRAQIEALALRLSIEHGDDAWEAEIIASHHRLARYEAEHSMTSVDDYKEWEIRHRAFNQALIGACRLEHLLRIQRRLYDLTERYRRQWLLAGIKQKKGVPYAINQKKIMDAALARNSELAAKLIFQHFAAAVKTIEEYYIKNKLFKDQA